MPGDATDRLAEYLKTQPEYLVEGFMIDFAGDTSDYIELGPDESVDFSQITPAQLGNGLRLWMEQLPAPDLPADLHLQDVDWARLGGQLYQIADAAMGGS